MTKILLCGLCPLPFENTLRNFGPGIRTWQFAHSLAAAGHRVHLRAMMIPGSYEANEAIPRETRDGVEIERVDDKSFCDVDQLRVRIDEFQPDALVGATIYGSNVLALSRPEVPFWADQFGHVMAEAQAKAMLEGENWPIEHFWSLLEPVLLRADKFSGVSRRQRYATIGELGVVGRLSHETCGYEFSTVIPCALTPADSAPPRPLLRGSLIPDDAFIVLWSGGYNVWSDTDTLFEGLEKAFARADNIHFVSTGGSIDGHDERTYPRFQERIARSRYRDRFHLQGWVRAELVPSFQAEANLGVLTEVQIYEGLLGHKNRIVQWMGAGLPLAYNRMGDLGALLAEEQLGLTFEIGDSTALAEQILWASRHPDALADMRRRALEYTTEELSFAATTRELVAWAEHPSLAPDAKSRAPGAAAVGSWQPSNPAVETTSEPPEVERERVHAVIVHHRGEAMLARCLESLMASIRVELEVVVVANHCQEPLPELAHTSPQVHVVTSETSLGFSAANNLGVAWAKQHLGQPEFYYFVNNDTESTEDALVRLIAALEARPEAAMAGPKLLILDADDHYNSLGINVTEDGWGWDEGIG
ncbi:MAG: glycosyltransferase, partial [Acidobacteriota bacterium]